MGYFQTKIIGIHGPKKYFNIPSKQFNRNTKFVYILKNSKFMILRVDLEQKQCQLQLLVLFENIGNKEVEEIKVESVI